MMCATQYSIPYTIICPSRGPLARARAELTGKLATAPVGMIDLVQTVLVFGSTYVFVVS